ncbi:hypothetical protein PanWU01x14_178560, partial [Parasponia andersonii]
GGDMAVLEACAVAQSALEFGAVQLRCGTKALRGYLVLLGLRHNMCLSCAAALGPCSAA